MATQQERGLTVRADRTVSDPVGERRLLANLILTDATEEERNLVLNICGRYNLDPLLKHVALIGSGNRKSLYITRDGLIRVAHQSGQFNGMQVVKSEQNGAGKWRVTVDVYRKDMDHPFRYTAIQEEHEQPKRGQYDGPWQKSPHAMTQKCAEVMALRRAFDVALGAAEEVGYDGSQRSNIGEVTIIDATPHELHSAPLAAPRGKPVPPQPAPPPLPAQPLDAAAFNAGVDAFLEQAEAGLTLGELRKLITDWDRELGQEQREEIRAHWAAIKEHRAQERATRLAPDATARQIIEAEVRVAPEPPTAAALAASDDPFGDGQPFSIFG